METHKLSDEASRIWEGGWAQTCCQDLKFIVYIL